MMFPPSWCLLYLLSLWTLVSSVAGQTPDSSRGSNPTRTLAALDTLSVTTVTETSAITVVSGQPLVGIVDFSTTTSTITIINPTSTTFATVTITPLPLFPELANELVPNALSTVTTTVLTTVFTPPVILKTRVVTELALTTLAGVTVTITITARVPTPTRDVTSGMSATRSSTVTASTETETTGRTSTTETGPGLSLTSMIVTQPTTTRTSTRNTMMTMVTTTSSTSSQIPTETAQPTPPADVFSQEMDRTRLAGIIISSILLALLLAGVTFWLISRRRRRQRYIQELILPRTGGSALPQTAGSASIVGVLRRKDSSRRRTGVGPRLTRRVSVRHDPLSRQSRLPADFRTSSPPRPPSKARRGVTPDSDGGSHSGLTGEGEVRIVIRPAPRNRRTASSHIFPLPPGYGYGYGGHNNPNMFVEETTTGESTPENPDKWSIASDQGSRGTSNNERAGGGGNVTGTASSSGGRPSGYTESYPLVTMLSPTPVARGNTNRRDVAPWETEPETPPRRRPVPGTNNGGESGSSGGQRSARSGRTDRTGSSSGGRAILGGSSRFPNVF